jgi:hypothetical protein
MLDAIQALQNEGTRGEVAQSYREQGNEAAREKRWIDAKEFYTKALAVVTSKLDKWDKPEDPKEEEKLLRQVEEASYINRALCNLELSMSLRYCHTWQKLLIWIRKLPFYRP